MGKSYRHVYVIMQRIVTLLMHTFYRCRIRSVDVLVMELTGVSLSMSMTTVTTEMLQT